MWVVASSTHVRLPILSAITLVKVEQTSKNCVCQPLLRALFCRLSVRQTSTTHPVTIFTLTDVFSKEFIARFLQNHNQKVHLFVRADCNSNELDQCSISFIPKFYIIAILVFRPGVMFQNMPVESENIFSKCAISFPFFLHIQSSIFNPKNGIQKSMFPKYGLYKNHVCD